MAGCRQILSGLCCIELPDRQNSDFDLPCPLVYAYPLPRAHQWNWSVRRILSQKWRIFNGLVHALTTRSSLQSMPPLELIIRSFNRLGPHFNSATGEFHSNYRSECTNKRDECQADVIGRDCNISCTEKSTQQIQYSKSSSCLSTTDWTYNDTPSGRGHKSI